MKKIVVFIISVVLFGFQFIFAQNELEKDSTFCQDKSIYLEAGINSSLPVHIEMYRSHRWAIGVNLRAFKKISEQWELGLRGEYDYRFARKNVWNPTPESTLKERAEHRNFSLISLKPNVQFNLNEKWHFGAEAGVAYAISDESSTVGFGFVEEYPVGLKYGACSGLYVGRNFAIGAKKRKLDLSLNLTTFLAKGHAENSLGLKLDYLFLK
jgi:hypothetical protein